MLGASVAMTAAGALWLRSVSSLEPRMGNVCNDLVTETDTPYVLIVLAFLLLLLAASSLAGGGRQEPPGLGPTVSLVVLTIAAGAAARFAAPLGAFLILFVVYAALVLAPLLLYAVIQGVQMAPGVRAPYLGILAADLVLPAFVYGVSLHPILSC